MYLISDANDNTTGFAYLRMFEMWNSRQLLQSVMFSMDFYYTLVSSLLNVNVWLPNSIK